MFDYSRVYHQGPKFRWGAGSAAGEKNTCWLMMKKSVSGLPDIGRGLYSPVGESLLTNQYDGIRKGV